MHHENPYTGLHITRIQTDTSFPLTSNKYSIGITLGSNTANTARTEIPHCHSLQVHTPLTLVFKTNKKVTKNTYAIEMYSKVRTPVIQGHIYLDPV